MNRRYKAALNVPVTLVYNHDLKGQLKTRVDVGTFSVATDVTHCSY